MSSITDRPEHIRHSCRVRGCYLDGPCPNWGVLNGCFPGRIRPSDIDGFVEIAGAFLWLEYKGAGSHLSSAQLRALRALPAQNKALGWNAHTLVVVTLRAEGGGVISVDTGHRREVTTHRVGVEGPLRQICTSWAYWARHRSRRA